MARGQYGENHPSATELERFLLGDMPPSQAGRIIAHLMPGCAECRQRVGPLASVMFANGPLALDEVEPSASADYDFPIFRALATARRYAATQTKPKSPRPVPVAPPPHEVPSAINVTAGSRLRARCEALLEQARALRVQDLEGMLLAATMAVGIAERMTPEHLPAAELADFQARAWAELGNAHRVADDLVAAETALSRSVERLGQGTGDPLLLARLMDLTASLYVDQRRFREARVLLDCVHRIYEHEGDPQAAARVLVSKGICANYALDSEEALGHLSEGLLRLDPTRDPKLALAAVHGLLWCLVDTGQAEAARTLLPEARGLYDTHGEHFDKLKRVWLEGRVAASLGEDQTAERAFSSVRAGYQQADLAYDTALVSLDLASVWLHQGRTPEIMVMVDEMITIFQARGIQREALAALLMLRNALEQDRATASLLRHVTAELWRLERIPTRSSRVPA